MFKVLMSCMWKILGTEVASNTAHDIVYFGLEEIHLAILFIRAHDRFSYMYFVMVDFDSFKRKLIPFESLKRKSGRSRENPPNGSKTAGRYAQPSFSTLSW